MRSMNSLCGEDLWLFMLFAGLRPRVFFMFFST